MTEILDLSGYKCPLPVLKARKVLNASAPGAELLVVCTDPAAPGDFRAFCDAAGHDLLAVEEQGESFRIRLRRRP